MPVSESVQRILKEEPVSQIRELYWKVVPLAKAADYAEARLIVQVATHILRYGEDSVADSCKKYIPDAKSYMELQE